MAQCEEKNIVACDWIISAVVSVDGFGKVSEQSEHNVLTFRSQRGKDNNNVFDDSKYKNYPFIQELNPCLRLCLGTDTNSYFL